MSNLCILIVSDVMNDIYLLSEIVTIFDNFCLFIECYFLGVDHSGVVVLASEGPSEKRHRLPAHISALRTTFVQGHTVD